MYDAWKKKSLARYYQNLLHRYLGFKPKLTVLLTRDSDFLYHQCTSCKSKACDCERGQASWGWALRTERTTNLFLQNARGNHDRKSEARLKMNICENHVFSHPCLKIMFFAPKIMFFAPLIFKQNVWYHQSWELYQENSEKRVSKIKY